jgi:hypothetical protein
MDVYCAIDCSEDHHDIALADRDGQLLARRRISDDAAGLTALGSAVPGGSRRCGHSRSTSTDESQSHDDATIT